MDTPLLSWSMAKSVLHAAVGILVETGRLDLDAPAAVPEWSGAGDPAAPSPCGQLLAMRDGLDWVEDYVDDRVSDVIQMLFGDGQADMAHFAADRPLAAAPGTRFNYSSGTSNIDLGHCGPDGRSGRGLRALLGHRVFAPIGMTSAHTELDAAGTWVGVVVPAGHRARLGPLRSALPARRPWAGVQVLPDGLGRLRPHDGLGGPRRRHALRGALVGRGGRHLGTFRASGYEGQSITICPALDLVVVRLGKTPLEQKPNLVPWRAAVVQAFARARARGIRPWRSGQGAQAREREISAFCSTAALTPAARQVA